MHRQLAQVYPGFAPDPSGDHILPSSQCEVFARFLAGHKHPHLVPVLGLCPGLDSPVTGKPCVGVVTSLPPCTLEAYINQLDYLTPALVKRVCAELLTAVGRLADAPLGFLSPATVMAFPVDDKDSECTVKISEYWHAMMAQPVRAAESLYTPPEGMGVGA